MNDQEKIMIGVYEINEAQRLAEILFQKGIEIESKHNKQTCSGGCRVTVEVWAKHKDIKEIIKLFKEEREKLLDGLNYDIELDSEVFDPNKENAKCPACGTSFSTKEDKCPDCGLGFSV